jgi:hypothetical protein
MRPTVAVWTAAIRLLAWLLSVATSIFMNPRGSEIVLVRSTVAIGMVNKHPAR